MQEQVLFGKGSASFLGTEIMALISVLMEYVQFSVWKFVRCFGFTNEIVVVIIQSRCENDSILEHIKTWKTSKEMTEKLINTKALGKTDIFKIEINMESIS